MPSVHAGGLPPPGKVVGVQWYRAEGAQRGGGPCAFYYILFKEKPSVIIPKTRGKDFLHRAKEWN